MVVKKKVVQKKVVKKATKIKAIKKPKAQRQLRARVKKIKIKPLREMLGSSEMVVEQSKFFQPPTSVMPQVIQYELPGKYDKDKLVLQVRDAHWLHSYWEITLNTWEHFKSELKDDFYKAKRVLRVYDISSIIFNGSNAHRFFDIDINEYADSWYIDTNGPGRSWCVDYGLLFPDGRFITILRSNTVTTPLDGPSWVTDEEWLIPDELFARLYGMGFGLGTSSPVGKAWAERIKKDVTSAMRISSGSPVKKTSK